MEKEDPSGTGWPRFTWRKGQSSSSGGGSRSSSSSIAVVVVVLVVVVTVNLKPNSITLAGSKLVPDRFEAKFHYATWFEPASNQLRTSSEATSVMEFGFYTARFCSNTSSVLSVQV